MYLLLKIMESGGQHLFPSNTQPQPELANNVIEEIKEMKKPDISAQNNAEITRLMVPANGDTHPENLPEVPVSQQNKPKGPNILSQEEIDALLNLEEKEDSVAKKTEDKAYMEKFDEIEKKHSELEALKKQTPGTFILILHKIFGITPSPLIRDEKLRIKIQLAINNDNFENLTDGDIESAINELERPPYNKKFIVIKREQVSYEQYRDEFTKILQTSNTSEINDFYRTKLIQFLESLLK